MALSVVDVNSSCAGSTRTSIKFNKAYSNDGLPGPAYAKRLRRASKPSNDERLKGPYA
jgi:hypothetical protein